MSYEKIEGAEKTRFSETRESFGDYTKIEIVNEKTGMVLEIIPEKGAKVNRLSYRNEFGSFDVIDGYNTPEAVMENKYSKSSVLAPFPNRVADGKYEFEGKEHFLPINMPEENNSIHGFVEHEEFEVVGSSQTEEGYEIRLRLNADGGKEGYPFPFIMDIVYRLSDAGLECETFVENTGSQNMPFGHGWHPYFKTEGSVRDLQLQISEVEQIEVDDRLIPTGVKTLFDEFHEAAEIADTQLDTGFKLSGGEGSVVLTDIENDIQISVIMDGEDNKYKYVQIFTPPDGCPAENTIAIEPMTCEANAFNSGEGLITLVPSEKFAGKFRVEVGPIELT